MTIERGAEPWRLAAAIESTIRLPRQFNHTLGAFHDGALATTSILTAGATAATLGAETAGGSNDLQPDPDYIADGEGCSAALPTATSRLLVFDI